MSEPIMTPELAWQWINYAMRISDARERIGELPKRQLIAIGSLLENSPLVHPHKVVHSPDFKPKIKTKICAKCGKEFSYEAWPGRRLYCSSTCRNTEHVNRWRRKQSAKAKAAAERERVLKGG